jgi:hypothetical protein
MDDLMKRLDRFAAFEKELEITEFDINTSDKATQADYTRDFMTATFSPALRGALRIGASIQRVHTRILQLNERGKFAFLGRLGQVAVRFRSEHLRTNMLISTPGTSVSTGVKTALIRTLSCAASLPSQNASKSSGRGVESPIFVGATAAPTAQSPLLRPVLPPTNRGARFKLNS